MLIYVARAIAIMAVVLCHASGDSVADQDLLARMYAALDGLHHADNRDAAERDRNTIRLRFEKALGFGLQRGAGAISALLYLPAPDGGAAPAIILVRPHEDPGSAANRSLAEELVRAGFVVLAADLRTDHDNTDLIATGGWATEALLQRDIRTIVDYLSRRADIDGRRIGIIGSGFSAALAAALDSRISAAALDALPNLREEVGQMASLRRRDLPDPCYLVYGLLRFASTEDLGMMISPRPLLVTNSVQIVSDYLSAVYQSYGALDKLRQPSCDGSSAYCSQVVREWIVSVMQNKRRDKAPSPGSGSTINISDIKIPIPQSQRRAAKEPLTPEYLSSLLGEPLPEARSAWALESTPGPQQVVLTTQPGFSLPATVLRPEGGESAAGQLVALFDAGRESVLNDEIVQSALRHGWFVWAVDVRGLGSLKVEREGFVLTASALLGENFAWRQASDVTRVLESLRNGSHTHRTALYARGQGVSVIAGYVAATADRDQPEWIVLRGGVDTFFGRTLPQYLLPMNCFELFDLRDLLKQAKPKIIQLTRVDEFREDLW